ncbi:hypothetical protein ACB092_12G117300 [Castanea dentata]
MLFFMNPLSLFLLLFLNLLTPFLCLCFLPLLQLLSFLIFLLPLLPILLYPSLLTPLFKFIMTLMKTFKISPMHLMSLFSLVSHLLLTHLTSHLLFLGGLLDLPNLPLILHPTIVIRFHLVPFQFPPSQNPFFITKQ